MFLPAKIRISEQRTKGKLVFLCSFERKYLLAERKDSANRTKNQNYLEFFSIIWLVHFFCVLLHIKTE